MPMLIYIPHFRWELFGSPTIAGQSNREIRLLSHSVEQFHDLQPNVVCQSSTHSSCELDLIRFFIFHRKTNIFICLHKHCLKWKLRPVITEPVKTLFSKNMSVSTTLSLSGSLDHCPRRARHRLFCELSAEVEETTDVMPKKQLSIENRMQQHALGCSRAELEWFAPVVCLSHTRFSARYTLRQKKQHGSYEVRSEAEEMGEHGACNTA